MNEFFEIMVFDPCVVHEVAVGGVFFCFIDGAKNYDIFSVGGFVVIEDICCIMIFKFQLFFGLGIKIDIVFGHGLIILIL